MAWIENGINLVEAGNDGTFDLAYNTWNVALPGTIGAHIEPGQCEFYRNTTHTDNSSDASCKIVYHRDSSLGQYQNLITFASYHSGEAVGKFYRIKAKVYLPALSVIGDPGAEIYLHSDNSKVSIIERSRIIIGQGVKSVQNFQDVTLQSETLETWIELYCVVKILQSSGSVAYRLRAIDNPQGKINELGVLYIDSVDIHEVTEGALEPAPADLPSYNVFSKNPVPVSLSSNNQQQENFRFQVELWMKDKVGSLYSKIVSLKGYPGLEGNYVFDLSKALMSYLEPEIPEFNQNHISFAASAVRKYYTVKKEFFGNPIEEKVSVNSTIKNAVMGGLSFIDWAGHNYYQTHFTKFLTWQLPTKKVSKDQQEYLAFAMYPASNLFLHCTITYDDNTTHSFTPLSKSSVQLEICVIPVGFTQLGLASIFPNKKVKKYTVWVSSVNDAASTINKSEERTYIIDYDFYRQERFFIYQNSFGFMDTLRFTGKFESGVSIEKQEADIALPVIYDPVLNSQFSEYNNRHIRTFKANSGHLTKMEKELMIEFLISENRYEIVKGRFIKIQLSSDKTKLIKDVQHMNALEIDYTYAHTNAAFSNL